MDANEKKILEYKRRIISLMRSREHTSAVKLYHKTFSKEVKPDTEFLDSFFIELNRVNLHDVAYEILKEAFDWSPDDDKLEELYKNATGIYFDHLVLQGNNLLYERDDKETKFAESIKKADSVVREKMREENDKVLSAIVQRAMETYSKALELNGDSVPALSGLMRCHQVLGENDIVEEINARIEELSPHLRSREKTRQELVREAELAEEERKRQAARELELEESAINELKKMFDAQQYHEVIKKIDELHLSHRTTVTLLLIKARAYAELRRFKAADQMIAEAEHHNRNINEVLEVKNNINETKYGILCRAGDTYLQKGLELGLSLGEGHFKRAQKCLIKALEFVPENLSLLDKLYTTQKYLGQHEESYKTKAMIYVLNKKYVTAFDRESSASLCFIASFAYQGEDRKIDDFRWFRREFLLTSRLGMLINASYVKISPVITQEAARLRFSRPLFRLALSPVRQLIRLLQHFI